MHGRRYNQNSVVLYADVERMCETCKGARFNPETLQVVYQGKTISDVLNMSLEEGEAFSKNTKRYIIRSSC